MAKKLMAVLLAVFMIVPLALSPAFAEPAEEKTYTGSVYYDSDTAAQIDANMEGYSQLPGDNYPQKAYTISAEFYLDWIDSGTESKYGRIIWDIQGYSFGYDAYNQTIFVAKSGWTINSGTNFIDTVPYTLEEQTFYRFSFTVQENHIKGYVNGELVLDTDVEGLWEPNRYVIFWPTCVGMHIVETKVAYADGTVLQSGSGANSFDGITGFKDGAYVSGDIADQMSQNEWDGVAPIYKEPIDEEFVLAELNEAIAALEVIKDDIKYDSIIDTDFTGAARFEFGPSGYDRVEKGFSGPARVDMTFAWTENKDGENGSVIGGSFGTSTVFMGYALDSQKFIIAKSSEHYFGQPRPTDPDRIYAESEETYALEQGKGYLMTLVFEKDYVAILLNGEEVLTSDEFNYAGFKDSVFLMHCINVNLILADLTITNINTGVVYPAGTHNTNNELKGQDATLTGPKYYDSYKVIADAEAAYNRLPEDVKTDDVVVAKYQVIADAKAAYVAQAPAHHI